MTTPPPPAGGTNELLRDRVLRRLDGLSPERQYQVLDYIEFLESRYAERKAPGPNVLQRFAEGIEDTLRAGNVSATKVAEAMGFLGKAMNVLSGVAAAGKSVASEFTGGNKPKEPSPPPAPGGTPASGTPPAGS